MSDAKDDVTALVGRLRDAAEAYPPDVFRPLATVCPHPTTREAEIIQSASASMGRHLSPVLTKAADALERLQADNERYAWIMANLSDDSGVYTKSGWMPLRYGWDNDAQRDAAIDAARGKE